MNVFLIFIVMILLYVIYNCVNILSGPILVLYLIGKEVKLPVGYWENMSSLRNRILVRVVLSLLI